MPIDPLFNTDAIVEWSYSVGLFQFMNSKYGWPLIESLHFCGLTMLIGTVGMFDLRMLGIAKRVSFAGLHRFVMVGVAGFALNATTGLMFLLSAPEQYLHNPAFQLKMMCIVIAGVNMIVFYATTSRVVMGLAPEGRVPISARVMAIISLGSWAGVITFGRLLTFFRPPYHWCFWC